jgi:proteasome assembly chaperone (PAC2) family protein
MPPLYWIHRNSKPTDPILVVAMEGWVDAGGGAALALRTLLAQIPNEVIVTFDTDHFIDLRARRPSMKVAGGVTISIDWPTIEMRLGRDREGNDLALLVGPEPDFHWHAFIDAVADIAVDMGVRMVIGLGAFPAPAPHTRPVRLTCTATSAELADRVGYFNGTIEVPAGIGSVLEKHFGERDIPAIGLWARVPHYAAAMSYPAAAAALVEGVSRLTGIAFDTTELRDQARETGVRIDELIAQNDEHREMVRLLELHVDSNQDAFQENPDFQFGTLPTGDEIAAELERYLRRSAPGSEQS